VIQTVIIIGLATDVVLLALVGAIVAMNVIGLTRRNDGYLIIGNI
jgi:hypothetical protein